MWTLEHSVHSLRAPYDLHNDETLPYLQTAINEAETYGKRGVSVWSPYLAGINWEWVRAVTTLNIIGQDASAPELQIIRATKSLYRFP
jgi:hypothetical protein